MQINTDELLYNWRQDSRWRGVVRPYTAADVVRYLLDGIADVPVNGIELPATHPSPVPA